MPRGYQRQILGGVRLAAIAIGCCALCFLLLDGISRVSSEGRVLGAAEVLAASSILWLTARVWAKWVAVGVFLLAAKSLIGWIAGTTLALPFRPVSRLVAAETLAYFLAAGLCCIPFLTRPPDTLEKAALVLFLLATGAAMIVEPSPAVLAAGCVALLTVRITPVIKSLSARK